LPRTGSSELGKTLSGQHGLNYIYEPFDALKKISKIDVGKNTLIKTVVFRHPIFVHESDRISWLIEFTKKFDQTILLSRKNLTDCAESWAYLVYNKEQRNFRDNLPYFWEKTPNYEESLEFIKRCHKDLEYISQELNIPITYYEDIYNPNDEKRLRRGNKKDLPEKLL